MFDLFFCNDDDVDVEGKGFYEREKEEAFKCIHLKNKLIKPAPKNSHA